MTPQAGCREPEQSALQVYVRLLGLQIRCDELWLVARAALELGMATLKFMPCQGMVEPIHSFRPMNKFKVAPHMIAVALHAGSIQCGMVALSTLQALTQVFMAGQAFVLAGPLSQFMTLGAIGQSFKRGMRLGQVTR